jgi:hypothetical protein
MFILFHSFSFSDFGQLVCPNNCYYLKQPCSCDTKQLAWLALHKYHLGIRAGSDSHQAKISTGLAFSRELLDRSIMTISVHGALEEFQPHSASLVVARLLDFIIVLDLLVFQAVMILGRGR